MGSVHAGRAGAGKEALQRGEQPETGTPAASQGSGVSALLCVSQSAPPSTWPQIPFTPHDLPVSHRGAARVGSRAVTAAA